MVTCLAMRSVAADGETPSPIPTYNGRKVINIIALNNISNAIRVYVKQK